LAQPAPAGLLIPNQASASYINSAGQPGATTSNQISTTVPIQLLLDKQAAPRVVREGDLITYTLTLVNPGPYSLSVRLEDTPDPHLAYQPGSATPAPRLEGGRLVWEGLQLPPRGELRLAYRMRVRPGAGERLLNTVQVRAFAQGAQAGAGAVASAQASALVRLEGALAPSHSLVGRVFLDTDRDGRYTPGVDLPLPGARVVLGNGLQATTDAEGRYGFRKMPGGWWTVMLEPASAPFRPRPHPEAQGEGYRRRVWVEGLAQSDFPLEAPEGLAQAMRETVLEFGPLRVHKRLLPIPGGFRVALLLQSGVALPELTLTDPLPAGGAKVFYFEQFFGEETLTYDLPDGFLTDPQVRWRYP